VVIATGGEHDHPRRQRTLALVPDLVLLNGPPASGKSTLAARLIESRPLALDLDLDVVRSLLGGRLDDPTGAGLAARRLAVEMARTHLRAGHDVVVPQFIGRVEFVEQLEAVADDVGARFVEIALVLDRAAAIEAFQRRRTAPEEQAHLDAAGLVDRSNSPDPVGEMYDRYAELLESRPNVQRIGVRRGDVEATLEAIEALLS
jgi:predicted kinase